MPTADDCNPWNPDGCGWTIRFLWRWTSSFGRLDVTVLALMLAYLFAVVLHVFYRYYAARNVRGVDSASRKTLTAVLNIEVGTLKSIALTAPYLGLAGTCEGILSALGGVEMAEHAALAMIVTRLASALIPTAAGIPVAVLATCSYNYLHTRIDLLESKLFEDGHQRARHFRGACKLPQAKRFSELPAFGLLATPALAIAMAFFFISFVSFHPSTGFYVELASAHCEYGVPDRLVVLHITDEGKLFLNQEQEDWNSLADRLSAIYSMREDRTLYLLADTGVPFRTFADALDTVENASASAGGPSAGMKKDKLGITVRVVTPKAFNGACTKPGHLVLR